MANNRNEKFLKKLGATIKKMREAKGLTTREFANRADIAYSQVWKIETGQVDPTISTLLAIANALEVSLEHLVTIEK
jgi:transcriptional regulator with XRE-family HTH domain